MLWLKAFHIIFMVTWFAGLLYLPRLFVYHCGAQDVASYGRFCTMERRLFRLMTAGAVLTVAAGLWLWTRTWGWPGPVWLQVKSFLALVLVGYHVWLGVLAHDFANYRNQYGARFYRLVNEVPTLFLIAMVILAVVKPF